MSCPVWALVAIVLGLQGVAAQASDCTSVTLTHTAIEYVQNGLIYVEVKVSKSGTGCNVHEPKIRIRRYDVQQWTVFNTDPLDGAPEGTYYGWAAPDCVDGQHIYYVQAYADCVLGRQYSALSSISIRRGWTAASALSTALSPSGTIPPGTLADFKGTHKVDITVYGNGCLWEIPVGRVLLAPNYQVGGTPPRGVGYDLPDIYPISQAGTYTYQRTCSMQVECIQVGGPFTYDVWTGCGYAAHTGSGSFSVLP